MTVTKASRALNVGERGVYHAKNVLENGTPKEIAAYPSASGGGIGLWRVLSGLGRRYRAGGLILGAVGD